MSEPEPLEPASVERAPVEPGVVQPASAGAVDPRGQRFAAAITTVVLAVVLLTQSVWLLVLQAAVFGIGATGVRRSPYAVLFARAVRPRIGPPEHTEDPQPPRFAQAVGLAFAVVGLVGFLAGVPALGLAATGLALAAAFLNAAFGFCLGCEAYLLVRRTVAHHPFPHRKSSDRNSNRASTPTEVSA